MVNFVVSFVKNLDPLEIHDFVIHAQHSDKHIDFLQ